MLRTCRLLTYFLYETNNGKLLPPPPASKRYVVGPGVGRCPMCIIGTELMTQLPASTCSASHVSNSTSLNLVSVRYAYTFRLPCAAGKT